MHTRPTFMSSRGRAGYTLIEVIAALVIAVLLFAALYSAFAVFMRQTEAGRNTVAETEEVRAMFARLTDDITSHLGPLDTRAVRLPKTFFEKPPAESTESSTTTDPAAQGTSGTTTNQTTQQTGQQGSTSTSNQQGTTSGAKTDGSTAQTEETKESETNNDYAFFNLGVYGDAETLTLFIVRPPDLKVAQKSGLPTPALGDLLRVSYWVAYGADGPIGLARQEVKIATSYDALSVLPFDGPNQEQYIIAPKVVQVSFEYFDGTAWSATWDGGQFGTDGKTPLGPPRAIAVMMVVRSTDMIDGDYQYKTYRQVIALPAANGIVQENTDAFMEP